MGRSVTIPPDHWYTRLKFHTNDTSTNTITCDDLGLHYRISTTSKSSTSSVHVTSFFRNHRSVREWGVLVAEWERRVFSTDRIRMAPAGLEVSAYGPEVPFVPINKFLPEVSFWSFKDMRRFIAGDGKQYVWKAEYGALLKLYNNEDEDVPIAVLSRSKFGNSIITNVHLARECEDIIDEIVVTCIIMEKRRERQGRQGQPESKLSAFANLVGAIIWFAGAIAT